MNVHLRYEMSGNAPENGMGSFFSPTNLCRYRSLVGREDQCCTNEPNFLKC